MDNRNSTESGNSALVITAIFKRYQKLQVFSNLGLNIARGSFTLLLGANGSGKSTLLRACAGLTRVDTGSIVFGTLKAGVVPYHELGFLGHDLFLYSHLTVEENLRLALKLTGCVADVNASLARWGLEDQRHKLISELSRGQRAKSALMRILARNPKYLLLDEPSSFLDDDGLSCLIESISEARRLNSDGCVFIATHDISRFKDSADRIVLLQEGVVARDSARDKADVIDQYGRQNR